MSLNRRDLLKALGAAPLCGLLGVAPEEEKILRQVDPEFVETIERPVITPDKGWKIEADVWMTELRIDFGAEQFNYPELEIGYTVQDRSTISLKATPGLGLYNNLSSHMCQPARLILSGGKMC